MALSKKSWTGVAREATPGAAATNPTLFVPTKSKVQNKTKFVYLDEDRNTRDANNDRVATTRMASGSLDGALYLDTAPYFFLAFMGGVVSSQPDSVNAPTAYEHDLTLADNPPTLTIFKGYDTVRSYYWAYAAVSKIKVKFSAEGKVLEYSTDFDAQFKTNYTGGQTPAYTNTPKALPGYAPTIKFATVQSQDVEDFELDLEQKITLFYPAAGSRSFAKVYYGERKASLSYTARFDADTDFEARFVSETDQALDITFLGPNLGGTVVSTFNLNFPIVGTDDADIDTSKDFVAVKYKGTARPGSAVNSLFTAKFINKITSYNS